jgi:hypothetical protein
MKNTGIRTTRRDFLAISVTAGSAGCSTNISEDENSRSFSKSRGDSVEQYQPNRSDDILIIEREYIIHTRTNESYRSVKFKHNSELVFERDAGLTFRE